MSLMMREKRDIKPVILKFGVILAFSLGGIIFSIFRAKRIKPSRSSTPKSQSFPEHGSNQVESGKGKAELRSADHHYLQKVVNSSGEDESSSHPRSSVDNCTCHSSPNSRSTGDKDVYLLPEFNELIKELDLAAIKGCFYSPKGAEVLAPIERSDTSGATDDNEVEVRILNSTIGTLKERVRSLEIQLLEYYGLKEQETAVIEMQNRLKINTMEAKLFSLKIEALQADKNRLKEQLADYAKVSSELEVAKSKIKILKKKLKNEAEQNKGYILALQERVVKLQEHENKTLSSSDVQLKLQKAKDLEVEAEKLRKSNHSLEEENSGLAHKLEYLQGVAASLLEDEEGEALKKEGHRLREHNEDLTSEIERLQAARCADIEELVYLRWINACLRYELRNYQPGPGKTVARDLSKSLSPKSEEKAKQLILEYAQKEGVGDKNASIVDFDSDQWSSSHSYLTDSGECDDSSVDLSSNNKTDTSSKSKIFGKLMRLLRGKDNHHLKRSSSLDTTPNIEDSVGRSSSYSAQCNSGVSPGISSGPEPDILTRKSRTSSQNSARLSLDLQQIPYFQGSRSTKGETSNYIEDDHRKSHDGSSNIYRVMGSMSEHVITLPEEDEHNQDQADGEKSELAKYAEALKGSRKKTSFGRRSVSFSSFKHF